MRRGLTFLFRVLDVCYIRPGSPTGEFIIESLVSNLFALCLAEPSRFERSVITTYGGQDKIIEIADTFKGEPRIIFLSM